MTGGVEAEGRGHSSDQQGGDDVCRVLTIEDHHQHLRQVFLADRTDSRNQLVHTREWLLHNKDLPLRLEGNLFVLASPLTGCGSVFVKEAPLPHVRSKGQPLVDLTLCANEGGVWEVLLHQTGPEDLEAWHVLEFEGGLTGCRQTLHRWQRSFAPSTAIHQTPRFLSNTWGDRNRDARIQQDFMLREIDSAAELGVDVVQIDDGWQKGISANSSLAKTQGGVWSGFWSTDPEFWTPHPERFPNGLTPVLDAAASHNMELGLWYAPDSSDEFAHWQNDVEQVLALHREFGVNVFKLDSINAVSLKARRNLKQLFAAIAEQSEGCILCDLDVTGNGVSRPGYLDAMGIGPVFVENRYTDWHSYWPHFTLRNLWQLGSWIAPQRLRMEFLNNERRGERYADDPLAPAVYPPATLFAITMFANPLGWFEASALSGTFKQEVASLAHCWRAHREAVAAGNIHPIGDAPNGANWTGFCSELPDADEAYAVVFNQKSTARTATLTLPTSFAHATVLHGEGSASVRDDQLSASIAQVCGYLFLRLARG